MSPLLRLATSGAFSFTVLQITCWLKAKAIPSFPGPGLGHRWAFSGGFLHPTAIQQMARNVLLSHSCCCCRNFVGGPAKGPALLSSTPSPR